jgi:aminocarboxymuconate-semialdehyde decarboxylase
MIDVHAHALHRDFLAGLARDGARGLEARAGGGFGFAGYGELDPLLFDMPGRIASLDARGITLQLVAPPPRIVSDAAWCADRLFARQLNQQTAAVVAESGGRLAGLAVPALADPEFAVAEVCRAMDEDGLVGVALPTSAAGQPLDNGPFEPLFAECARRGCPVFMHPTTGVDRPALASYSMLQLVGWPTETALCVARLIFAGVWERHPGFRLILGHGGGALMALAGRLDLAYDAPQFEANPACHAHISRRPSSYLRHILFDTCVAHPGVLTALLDIAGPSNVVFGTDFPFEIGDAEGRLALPTLDALDPAVRQGVLGGTMAALLEGARA